MCDCPAHRDLVECVCNCDHTTDRLLQWKARAVAAEDECERLRAGEDPTPAEEGTERNPGQFLRYLHQMTGDERIVRLTALKRDVDYGVRCVIHGHEGLRHELDVAERKLRQLRAYVEWCEAAEVETDGRDIISILEGREPTAAVEKRRRCLMPTKEAR